MRKSLLLFSVLAVLAMPLMAAPRDDDPRGPRDAMNRIVRFIKHVIRTMEDGNVPIPPHP
jgi:hypothetical protein